ncbi:DUF202 domain-containing protein [candidate division KSB1 bacterium]|nr:DUF202 domain-containing protein [candidate division KSB1 bacterium]RQW10446.1 MAG: DUF202 domain-containing protein [candidate division KSB1 bacterium]
MDDFQKESLLFRDLLALERTKMANERTLMAYIRTALMLIASGVSLLELYRDVLFLYVFGILFLCSAAALIAYSSRRFVSMKKRINRKVT